MSQTVEEFVKPGQLKNLISMVKLRWESTTIAGTLQRLVLGVKESGATPLAQIRDGSTALSQFVLQHMNVKKVTHLVSHILAV